MVFRHHQWHLFRHAIIPPHLQNVLHQLRLAVQSLPGNVAGFEGIVLEGNKREVGDAAVSFEVIDETPHPRSAPLRVRPHVDVFIHALKNRPTQF